MAVTRRIYTTDQPTPTAGVLAAARFPAVGVAQPGRITMVSFHGQTETVENLEAVTVAFHVGGRPLNVITQRAGSSVIMRSLEDLMALSGDPLGELIYTTGTVNVDGLEWPASVVAAGQHEGVRFGCRVGGQDLLVGVSGRGLSLEDLDYVTILDLAPLIPSSWR